MCVVGTNGKTTVTNLLADALERRQRVVRNRPGANLTSWRGDAAAARLPLSDWGVFEATSCGWRRSCRSCRPPGCVVLPKPVPRPAHRGQIDYIQDSIVGALEKSLTRCCVQRR